MYYASKIFGFFAIPSNFIILLGLFGALLLRTRFSRWGWRLAIGSLVLLAVIGLSPVGNALIVPLEQRFPPWDHSRGAPHGMVVLGGALSPDVSHARNTVALNEAAERLTVVAELARRYPDARIIFSGGSGCGHFRRAAGGRVRAAAAGEPGRREGPRRRRGQVAQHGRECAVLARAGAAEAGRALAAGHLGLSPATRRRHLPQGRLSGRSLSGRLAHPRHRRRAAAVSDHGRGLRRTDTAMREWIGLAAYWVTGQTSELFPGPTPLGECDRAAAGGLDSCRP